MGFGAEAVEYQEAWDEQRRVHAARFLDEVPDTCLLLEHPPVYTAGRRTADNERPLDGTPVIDVDRGGKITWHGPGQLVGYPILKLPRPVDVVAHVRRLEDALIRTAADFGLETSRVEGRSGVWVLGDEVQKGATSGGLTLDFDPRLADEEFDPRLNGPEYAPSNAGQRREDRKLAAIGIRVAKGVTMHGFALNCNPDNTWYDRIVPKGRRIDVLPGASSVPLQLGYSGATQPDLSSDRSVYAEFVNYYKLEREERLVLMLAIPAVAITGSRRINSNVNPCMAWSRLSGNEITPH